MRQYGGQSSAPIDTKCGYALLLRNLLPAYQRMENGLERQRRAPGIRLIAIPALYRSDAMSSDRRRLFGDGWSDALPLVAAAERYAERVTVISAQDGARLIAHAYVRYMGDLSGGQILKRFLSRSLRLMPDALSFYDFPSIDDIDEFKIAYLRAIDQAGLQIDGGNHSIVEEAAKAFRLNIAVSIEVGVSDPSR